MTFEIRTLAVLALVGCAPLSSRWADVASRELECPVGEITTSQEASDGVVVAHGCGRVVSLECHVRHSKGFLLFSGSSRQLCQRHGDVSAWYGSPSTSSEPTHGCRCEADPESCPFKSVAARLALDDVPLESCVAPSGPRGTGHVLLTVYGDGTVADAEIDQPPFADTSVGDCVADRFRTARVPPFCGGPLKVGKFFELPPP